jgi:UV excision repair protein RAD23
MKLIIKNLKQVPHEVDVADENVTVRDLKKAIEDKHGFDSACLKLLFNGVVLDDNKRLAEHNIKDSSVIIMMNTKAKPVNVPKEEPKTEVPSQVHPQGTGLTGSTKPPTSTTSTTTSTRPPVQPKDYTNEVKTLTEMGFPKQEAEAAIKAARGNVDIAVEFLYNGIPENLPQEGEDLPEQGGGHQGSELKKVASIIKILCSQNASNLQNILLGIQQNDPGLMELIKQNEEEFKILLQQPINDEDIRNFQTFQNQARGAEGQGAGGSETGSGSGPTRRGNTIALSKQDYDAVGRLKELGFSEMDAVQAYFACDKNEDLAANLLWENKLKEQEQELFIDCKLFYFII